MQIFETKMGHGFDPEPVLKSVAISLCFRQVRKYFDLPSTKVIKEERRHYYLTVHDRQVKNAVKVKLHIGRGRNKLLIETENGWSKRIEMYITAENTLRRLLRQSGKEYLYVRLEEA